METNTNKKTNNIVQSIKLLSLLITSLFLISVMVMIGVTYPSDTDHVYKDIIPVRSNKNIEGTYLKINSSEMININGSNQKNYPSAFLKDTLTTNNKQTKEIFNFKLFGLEKLYPIKLYEVHNLKIKGLSGDNYYVTDIKTNIKDNKTINTVTLSHVNSSVLKTLDMKGDKEIIISDNLVNLKKDTIVTLSKNNTISINDNAKEETIDYSVKNKTYYKYNTSKPTLLGNPPINIFVIIVVIVIGLQITLFKVLPKTQ